MRVRDEPFDPATVINGEALHEEEDIMNRWENYFKDLLNPSGVRAQGTQSRFNPSHPDHSEPTTLGWRGGGGGGGNKSSKGQF